MFLHTTSISLLFSNHHRIAAVMCRENRADTTSETRLSVHYDVVDRDMGRTHHATACDAHADKQNSFGLAIASNSALAAQRGLKRVGSNDSGAESIERGQGVRLWSASSAGRILNDKNKLAAACLPAGLVNDALPRLRDVLQSMTKAHRRKAVASMAPHIRQALLKFMENPQARADVPAQGIEGRVVPQHTSLCAGVGLRSIPTVQKGTLYKAQLHLKSLRFYTRGVHQASLADTYQKIFAQLRQEIHAAGEGVWADTGLFCRICRRVFADNSISAQEIGLSVFVFMRVDKFLGRNFRITSPVMPLADALVLQSRLLHARQTSWDSLRTEWVLLMQRAKGLSELDAEAVADKARQDFLEQRLAHALRCVDRGLKLKERRAVAAARAWAREHRKSTKVHAAAAARLERYASKQRQRLWVARRRWSGKVRELTMDNLMGGLPPYLCAF